MPLTPAILEMGMGIDLHGQNYTEAAKRATWNAVHQSSLMFLGLLGTNTSQEMIVEVTIGIPKPDAVNHAEVLSVLPHGKGVLNCGAGRLGGRGQGRAPAM